MNTRFGVAKLISASESTRTVMRVIGAAAATFLIVLPAFSSIPALQRYGDFYSMF